MATFGAGLNLRRLLLGLILFDVKMLTAFILPPFFWSPRNPYFHEKTCGDYAHWYVNSGYYLNVICPSAALPPKELPDHIPRYKLFENMFIVSKEEFDSCSLDQKKHPRSRALMYCDKSQTNDLQYHTLHFKPVRAWSGGLAFPVNKTYYFIGTGNGTYRGVKNTAGGRCKTDNMKLAITVCGWDCSKCKDFCCKNPTNLTTTVATTTRTTKRTTDTNIKQSRSINLIAVTPKPTQQIRKQMRTINATSDVDVINSVEDGNGEDNINVASNIPESGLRTSKQMSLNKSFGSHYTDQNWMMLGLGIILGFITWSLVYLLVKKGPKLKRIWHKHNTGKPYQNGNSINHKRSNSLKRLVSTTDSGDVSPTVEPTTPIYVVPPTVKLHPFQNGNGGNHKRSNSLKRLVSTTDSSSGDVSPAAEPTTPVDLVPPMVKLTPCCTDV